MFAKKLGRLTAGLFVAFGLAFGGASLLAADSGGAYVAAGTTFIGGNAAQLDVDWS